MSALPRGWVEAEFGDVFDFKGGSQPPKSEFYNEPSEGRVRLLQIRDFASDEKAVYIRDNAKWPKCSAADIMIGRYGASVGKILSGKAGAYNVALVKLEFSQMEFDRRWVQSYLKTNHFQRPLFQISRSAQNGFNKEDLKEVPVPIPPLAEQKRIVAKLDALNAKSARARTELARIETLVSRYKQAVLSKAFSGELVGLSPHVTVKPHAFCWDLPLGWRWVVFEDAVEIASKLVNPDTIPELPHIAPDNIESGTARLLPFKTIGEDGVISAKHRFFSGQILYSKIRPYLRKAVIADFDGACSADMYPLSPRDVLSARYLLQWLVSEQFTHFAVKHQGRTVLPKINQAALNKTPLPLPPLATQHEIVRRIESAFAKIDRLAKEARRALELVGRLDEAILAKAFRGELVPQDENDEPAELLFARIRAEREAAPKTGRGRRAKA